MDPTSDQLQAAGDKLFADIAASTSPLLLLSHFSDTEIVVIDHAHIDAHPAPNVGLNAVRSYFDILTTHWSRSNLERHETFIRPESHQVICRASVWWTWRSSGRKFKEEFTVTVDWDDQLKVRFIPWTYISIRF
jgi:hypothetical protein